jgi:glucosylceramidase
MIYTHIFKGLSLLVVTLLLLATSCGESEIPVPPAQDDGNDDTETAQLEHEIDVYRSDREGLLKLARLTEPLSFDSDSTGAGVNVLIDDETTYQSMVGFGAALTGSSAYVISTHLSEARQDEVLRDLFDPEEGIGISFIRLTIGASDFSLSDYTYNDLGSGQSDRAVDGFDLSMEEEYLIPILRKILEINPDLNIMATPWSPPAWMKTNENLENGGRLKGLFQDSYAIYLVKYIKAMEERGIPIHSITVQNEPLYAAPYMSMEMSSEEQKIFIRDHLGPMMETENLDTKVIIYDHNWDDIGYPMDILSDPSARQYIDGTAFHCYAGDVNAMSTVHDQYPDFGIYFTECSGGDFAPDYAENLSWNVDNLIVGATRNWSKSVLFWNLALDENSGPRNGGCQNCRGVVTVNSANGTYTTNEEYVLLGHIGKFVRPGAVRIKTLNTRSQNISQVAFKNTDESVVIVAFNHRNRAQTLRLRYGDDRFAYELESGMLTTFVLNPK